MLSQQAQEKVDKYRAGYAAQGMRHAFLPAVVSTSGRIHGELLRLPYIFADRKTMLHFRALGEAVDVDSEAYWWRWSGFFLMWSSRQAWSFFLIWSFRPASSRTPCRSLCSFSSSTPRRPMK